MNTGTTVKVYEIANDLNIDPELVLQKIRSMGIDAKNKMSRIDVGYVDQIRSSLMKDRQARFVEVEVAPGVLKLKRVEPPPEAPRPVRPAATRPATPSSLAAARRDVSAVEPRPVEARAPEARAPEARAPEPVVEARHEEPARPVTAEHRAAPVTAEHRAAPVETHAAPAVEEPARPVTQEHRAAPVTAEHRAAPVEAHAAPVVEEPARPVAQEPARPVTQEHRAAPVVEEPARPVTQEHRAAPVEAQPEPVAPPVVEARPEPVAPPVVEAVEARAPVEEPPVEAAAPVAARPSAPPPPMAPKTGIARWDPIEKKVVYEQTRPPVSQRPTTSMGPGAPAGTGKRWVQTAVAPGPVRRPPGPSRPGGPNSRNIRPGPGFRQVGPPSKAAPSPEMAQHKKVIKIEAQISLQELARRMSLKATDVLLKLIQLGDRGKNINSTLDSDTAKLLASEFGYSVEDVALNLDDIIKRALPTFEAGEPVTRSPVVTVMGHVDHGKTTLLDAILGMRVAEGEAGGITQEVRAYRVSTAKGMVVFFDTPGHEAFTALRARGAQLTDVAVLVVAADDGVMPTTVEAIKHAKDAKVPLVVALNKIDKADANPDRVLQQLMQHDVIPEEFGGETLVVRVSAKTKQGIPELLESLALQSELLDLRADAKRPGVGQVFEAKLDKGRGPVARVLVQEGVLRNGDVVVVGSSYGRVRAMFDDRGKSLDKAGPSTPVEILGLSDVPNAGDKLYVAADLRKAQEVADQLRALTRKDSPGVGSPGPIDIQEHLRRQKGDEPITISVVVKADAQGAVEGLSKALTSLSTDKVQVRMLHGAVGAITENDVNLAVPSNAVIIGFNVRPAGKAAALAEEQKVQMRYYTVIYEAVDDIKALMLGQLKPTYIEKLLGRAEIRQVFNITRTGIVAGCMVTEGTVKRNARARLIRDNSVKYDGKISSLRRIKEDVKEVAHNTECGISLDNPPDLKAGDIIEAYELEEVAASL